MRDRLDGLWHDEDFADWYPRDGRPGLSPAQLATVCVLQFLLGLSDRQAAEAVRCRIDFKYAMAMELDDPGFHHSVLADFRDRLAEGDRADRLLDLALARLKEAGLVHERTTQRTDSTHSDMRQVPTTVPARRGARTIASALVLRHGLVQDPLQDHRDAGLDSLKHRMSSRPIRRRSWAELPCFPAHEGGYRPACKAAQVCGPTSPSTPRLRVVW
ncbi:transposase [Streptomyces sp. NBC_01619]|uniref:transposase n=1 Tax=unclassified Streptomyces TaxID=2593676 RepID=UPI0022514952|nr:MULTISPECIES: transposase [unclassified Streptomyces]MCX4515661.1 transposase [Streptomyces sp. NBC_01619]